MGTIVMYCKKCGRIVQDLKKCDVCGSSTYQVPKEWLISDTCPLIKFDLEEQFIEECIKSSPEFNQTLFDQRDSILKEHHAEYERTMAIGKAIMNGVKPKDAFNGVTYENAPKCPNCGSANISKVGTLNRAVSVGIFGLASSKIGKTHKCNNCGTTW